MSFDDACSCIAREAERVSASAAERVPLAEASGRVLAQDVRADRDFPPFARSTRDGFAIQAGNQRSFRILGEVRAGQRWKGADVSAQICVAIMTGAPLPGGADAVVMREHVEQAGDSITLREAKEIRSGENFVAQASEAARGAVVILSGMRLNAASIGMAAACGQVTLQVHSRPGVAVLATGDELVAADQPPSREQIRNSNSYALVAAVEQAGGLAAMLQPARDTRESLRRQLEIAFRSDMVLVAGGVSAGKYDLAEQVLAEDFGAEFFFTGVRLQPGRPVVFGRARDKYFFGLPGNPVSALVTFGLLARPMLAALGGETRWQPRFANAMLEHDVSAAGELTRILPAYISSTLSGATVRQIAWRGSGDMVALTASNGFLVLPEGTPARHRGDPVTVWMND